jgi:hypothetical protein
MVFEARSLIIVSHWLLTGYWNLVIGYFSQLYVIMCINKYERRCK